MTELELGYKASAEQFGPSELLEFAVAADRLGFDTVAVSDHLQPWRHTGGHAPFTLACLGAAGQRTERLTLGTSVLTPTFRYHPVVVAQAFATLALLTPGRVWLGLGSGEALNELAITSVWPSPSERLQRLEEAITIIRRLWAEDAVTYEGRYYQARNVTLYDRPIQPLPLHVAASGPRAAALAGRLGDGLIATSGKDPALYQETLLPAFRQGALAAGRDPSSLQLTIEMKVSFDRDRRLALEATRHWGALALSAEEKRDVDDPRELERRADALPLDRVASRWIVSSDPDEHVAAIQHYAELGFRRLLFHAPGPDQLRFLEQYADAVLPRLRALRV